MDPAWLATARFDGTTPVLGVLARRHLRGVLCAPVAAWGALGFGVVLLLQNLGMDRTSVSHAALIVGAVPALVAVTAAAVGRASVGPLAWLGSAVALGGVGLVAGAGGGSSAAGDALVLVSAALCAVYIVAQTRLLEGRDAVAVTAGQMGAAAVGTLPLALAGGAPVRGPATLGAVAATALLVTVGSLLPFALYAY